MSKKRKIKYKKPRAKQQGHDMMVRRQKRTRKVRRRLGVPTVKDHKKPQPSKKKGRPK